MKLIDFMHEATKAEEAADRARAIFQLIRTVDWILGGVPETNQPEWALALRNARSRLEGVP